MRIWMKHLLLVAVALLCLMGCTLPFSSGPKMIKPDGSARAVSDCQNALKSTALRVAATRTAVTSGAPVDFTICSRQAGFITMWSTAMGGRVWPVYTAQVPGKAEPHVVRDYEVHGTPGWKYVYIVWTRAPDAQPLDRPTCRLTANPPTPYPSIARSSASACLVAQLAIEIIR
jgi:hypothetical protein